MATSIVGVHDIIVVALFDLHKLMEHLREKLNFEDVLNTVEEMFKNASDVSAAIPENILKVVVLPQGSAVYVPCCMCPVIISRSATGCALFLLAFNRNLTTPIKVCCRC